MNYFVDELVRSFKQKIVTYLLDHNLSLVHFYDAKERVLLDIVQSTKSTDEQILSIYSLWGKVDSENFFLELKHYVSSKSYNKDLGMLIMSSILLHLNETSLNYFDQKINDIALINDQIHQIAIKYSQKLILS